MNPGLVVKLRPSGPWRIGPESGARNRADAIYHSDSLYSAVSAAMARLGSLEDWLDATARNGVPAVSFSSCYPFLDEIGFIVPPRTVWPPTSPALMSARVRWKSARFVPLGMVPTLLSGQPLDESQWSVDGPSECLVPAGRHGPFRTGVRWGAAVDRLTGATERHSTACIEFRPGAGLWSVVSFQSEAAHARWLNPVKAAFRLLADTGFGGERSRGWGRSEAPEFIDGTLPDLILPAGEALRPVPDVETASAELRAPSPILPVSEPEASASAHEAAEPVPEAAASQPEPPASEPGAPATELQAAAPESETAAPEPEAAAPESETAASAPEAAAPEPEPEPEPAAPQPEPPVAEPEPATSAPQASASAPVEAAREPEAGPAEPEPPMRESEPPAPEPGPPAPEPLHGSPPVPPAPRLAAHWLLSLFTPSPADTVDWRRGNYSVIVRSGRVESPAGSGELKKQVQMVAEGSVLYAAAAPRGAAADVAPDGFAHPVFRAGFALAIPLPEVS